ncbi:MAG: hypothetical protein Q9157_005358 [Trypethelium eluteriae]
MLGELSNSSAPSTFEPIPSSNIRDILKNSTSLLQVIRRLQQNRRSFAGLQEERPLSSPSTSPLASNLLNFAKEPSHKKKWLTRKGNDRPKSFFVANYKDLGSSQHPIGQMWKEYALSDSRYLTSDPLVLSVEALTAIYGDILYYATNTYDHFFNHISYSRPEAFYFWVYYFLMNFFWIVIPSGK